VLELSRTGARENFLSREKNSDRNHLFALTCLLQFLYIGDAEPPYLHQCNEILESVAYFSRCQLVLGLCLVFGGVFYC